MALVMDGSAVLDAAIFRSKDPSRFGMTGVNVEAADDGHVLAVASDGHRLIAIHAIGQVDGPTLISPAALETLAKAKARSPWIRIDDHGMMVVLDVFPVNITTVDDLPVAGPDGVYAMEVARCSRALLVDDVFPHGWRRLLEKGTPTLAPRPYNPSYLGDYAKLRGPDGSKAKGRVISLEQREQTGAIVHVSDRPDVFSLLMPAAVEMASGIPSWLVESPVEHPAEEQQIAA